MEAWRAERAKAQAKAQAQSRAKGLRDRHKRDQLVTAQAYGYGGAVTSAALQDALRVTGAPSRAQSPAAGRPVSAMKGSSLSYSGQPRADIGTRIALADGMQRRWRRGK